MNYRKVAVNIIWWSASGLKVPNTSIQKENDKSYIIRKRAGYSDKILVKVLKESKNYSIIDNYTTLELKELGYSTEEINNQKKISLYDEILLYPTKWYYNKVTKILKYYYNRQKLLTRMLKSKILITVITNEK